MLSAYTSQIAATACGVTDDEDIVATKHIDAFLIATAQGRLELVGVWFGEAVILVKDDEADATGLCCFPGEGGDGRYCQMRNNETGAMESGGKNCRDACVVRHGFLMSDVQ